MLFQCTICTKKVHADQFVLLCNKCLNSDQTYCSKLSKSQTLLYLNLNEEYLYKICLDETIPFQRLHDYEFSKIFQHQCNMGVSKLVTDCLKKELSLDNLIKTECKFRSAKNSLAN